MRRWPYPLGVEVALDARSDGFVFTPPMPRTQGAGPDREAMPALAGGVWFIRRANLSSVARQGPVKTAIPIFSNRRTPAGVYRICGFFTHRRLTTWWTADSTKAVEIVLPRLYRSMRWGTMAQLVVR